MIPEADRRNFKQGKAQSNINDRLSLHFPYESLPPDLAAVVFAWPTLPEPIRAGILAMINASSGKRDGQ
jgi:hypothetical protein